MKTLKSLLVLSPAIACFLLAAAPATAGTLTITLLAPFQSGEANAFAFTATVTNTSGSIVYLTADSSNLDAPLTLDDSPYSSFPLSLGPWDSQVDSTDSYTGVLFNVDVPYATPLGLYTGSFQILGSSDPADSATVAGSADFDVLVTPEPSSFLLFGAGLLASAVVTLRKLQLSL